MSAIDKVPVKIEISGLEILTLKKLSLISHALATRLPYESRQEQTCLATTLDDVIRRLELASVSAHVPER